MMLDYGKLITLTGEGAIMDMPHVTLIKIWTVRSKCINGRVTVGKLGLPGKRVDVDFIIYGLSLRFNTYIFMKIYLFLGLIYDWIYRYFMEDL